MTIKGWHIDHQWQESFVSALSARGASGQAVSQALAAVDDELSATGSTAQERFGDPAEHARRIALTDDPALRRASQTRGVLLALLGLLGMALALWGFTAVARRVDEVIGMSPVVPLVLGLLLVVGSAIADSLLGQRADIVLARMGAAQPSGAKAFVLNRLGPWLVVLLTLVGMLLIWLRDR